MKCVATRDCQTRTDEGKIRFFQRGQVHEFKKCPTHFVSLEEDHKVDFATAGEDELLNAKWTFKDAAGAIKKAFGISLQKSDNKQDIVREILDIQFRNEAKDEED